MKRDGMKATAQDCQGCRNDFYNGNEMSMCRDENGRPVCGSLASAKLVRTVQVHVDQPPPFYGKPVLRPACYRRPRYVYLRPDHPQLVANWRH